MSLQYLRNLSLVAAQPSGKGIELGALRCVFETRRGDRQTPNSCDVRIYNPAPSTVNMLQGTGSSEFTQLTLKVSYGSQPLAQIFWGSITQVRAGRIDQRDSYVDITAADGDEPYNFAPFALTLAASKTPYDGVLAILQGMARYKYSSPTGTGQNGQPITLGYVPPQLKDAPAYGRARSYYGNCRDQLRQIADSVDCWHSVQDGQLIFIPKTGFIPAPSVVISPQTGLVGVPEQTQNGLKLRVLLNPALKIGHVIKLQSTDVNQLRYGLDITSNAQVNPLLPLGATKPGPDGLYYVMRVEHSGDTRGQPWYSDLICLSVNASLVSQDNQAFQSQVVSNLIRRW